MGLRVRRIPRPRSWLGNPSAEPKLRLPRPRVADGPPPSKAPNRFAPALWAAGDGCRRRLSPAAPERLQGRVAPFPSPFGLGSASGRLAGVSGSVNRRIRTRRDHMSTTAAVVNSNHLAGPRTSCLHLPRQRSGQSGSQCGPRARFCSRSIVALSSPAAAASPLSPAGNPAAGCRSGWLEIQSRSPERPESVRPDGSAFVRAEGATLVAAPAKVTTGGSSQGLLQTHVYGCTHDYYTYIVGATDRGAVGDARLAAAL